METGGMKMGGSQFVWLCVQQDKYQIEFFIKEWKETLPAMQREPKYDLESIKKNFSLPLASGEELRVVNFESASCVALSTSGPGVCLRFIVS
ncbi:hypothetical protein QQF64_017428 [Cirrhinus molitorella]|uniref:Uncharacterized protein n=1 Tax=Cirrhinus molitorella TaxID=172907 RepID=A0ABR3LK02_9TELE